jgi:hypothetical protein
MSTKRVHLTVAALLLISHASEEGRMSLRLAWDMSPSTIIRFLLNQRNHKPNAMLLSRIEHAKSLPNNAKFSFKNTKISLDRAQIH